MASALPGPEVRERKVLSPRSRQGEWGAKSANLPTSCWASPLVGLVGERREASIFPSDTPGCKEIPLPSLPGKQREVEEGHWVKEEGKGGMKPNRQKGRQSSKRPRCPPRRTDWKQNLGTRHRLDLQTHSEVPSHGPPLPPTGHPVTLPMVTWRPEALSPALQWWGESRDPDASHSASQFLTQHPAVPPAELHSTQPCYTMHPTVPTGSPTELHRAPQCHTVPPTKTSHNVLLATWGFP